MRIASDDYSPYFYFGETGDFEGIDVELATEACRRMGYKPQFMKIVWSNKDAILNEGEADLLWGSFSMTGREDRYEWAGPYMNSRQVVVVKQSSEIQTLADLYDKRIGVQMTTKPDEIFSAGATDKIPEIRDPYCFSKMDYTFAALRKGYVDAIAGHETAVMDFIGNAATKYRVLDEPLMKVQLGAAAKKDSPEGKEIVTLLSKTFAEMHADGFTAGVLSRYGLDAKKALEGLIEGGNQ
ncbi:MAG: transporter substrate-binding domain-containing protein [Clostridiales bacterium]|nr:transporter substrate-binding domain-containing protein [Clostridiales bacterium]